MAATGAPSAAALEEVSLPHIDEAMMALTRTLAKEINDIKRERQLLAEMKDALDKIQARITSVAASENERLKINVGGSRFEIRASCIQKNTYFRSLLSGTFAPADADGFFYIDRDPYYMPFILSFLREGEIDLESLSDKQLDRLRSEAEFYMVQELQARIEQLRNLKRTKQGLSVADINRQVPTANFVYFNGIVFEFVLTQPDLRLHSISFVAGERRKIVGEVYLKVGSIDAPGRFEKIGDVDEMAEKNALLSVTFSAVALTNSVYTLAVYSASCPTAIAMVPKGTTNRDYSANGFKITRSFHTADPRGQFARRAGLEDDFDFVGQMTVSMRGN